VGAFLCYYEMSVLQWTELCGVWYMSMWIICHARYVNKSVNKAILLSFSSVCFGTHLRFQYSCLALLRSGCCCTAWGFCGLGSAMRSVVYCTHRKTCCRRKCWFPCEGHV
jgi:hypothetical protein